jgi:hypothetical protein
VPMRSNLAVRPWFSACSICNELVELETSTVDKAGNPVHQECFLQKGSLKKSVSPASESPGIEPNSVDKSLPGAIIEFLNSASAHSTVNSCPQCGARLEYREYTFVYEGRSWLIPVPFCDGCHTPPPPRDTADDD